MNASARQQEIKEAFVAAGGTWDKAWEAALQLDPEFLQAYRDSAHGAASRGLNS